MARERYDLVVPAEQMEIAPLPQLLDWLRRPATALEIENFGGYETAKTGQVLWVA
jgi:molybdate-binding protein